MVQGTVKWFSHNLGHGFILCEDPLGDVFIRTEDIRGGDPWSLDTGDEVTFEVIDTPEGKEARTVSKVFPAKQLRGDGEKASSDVGSG